MSKPEITEDMIFQCFAAAQQSDGLGDTAASFVDVEEYENKVMYPEFARWAKKANRPDIADIYPRFRDQALEKRDRKSADIYQRVIDSECQHAEWFESALNHYRQELAATA